MLQNSLRQNSSLNCAIQKISFVRVGNNDPLLFSTLTLLVISPLLGIVFFFSYMFLLCPSCIQTYLKRQQTVAFILTETDSPTLKFVSSGQNHKEQWSSPGAVEVPQKQK